MAMDSSDDESAEMERVRARLRDDPSRMFTSPGDKSDLSLSETSDSSVSSESGKSTSSSQIYSYSRPSEKVIEATTEQAAPGTNQLIPHERRNSQLQPLMTRLSDSKVSRSVEGTATGDMKRECSSATLSKPISHEESDFEDNFSFLDDYEALDELDRQIEASIQAKAETSEFSQVGIGATAGRSNKFAPHQDSKREQGARRIDTNDIDDLQFNDKVLDELDRKVEATLQANPPSNNLLWGRSDSDLQKSPGMLGLSTRHSEDTKQSELETKDSTLKISQDIIHSGSVRARHGTTQSKEIETELEPAQWLSSRGEYESQNKVRAVIGRSKKKRKHDSNSSSERNRVLTSGPSGQKRQRRAVKTDMNNEKVSSVSQHASSLGLSCRPFQGGKTVEIVKVAHSDAIDGTERVLVDSSSEDSFAFFNENEISKIEERARSQQQKRISRENRDCSSTPAASTSEAVLNPAKTDSVEAEDTNLGSSDHDESMHVDFASPPQCDNSRAENDFDKAFGFHVQQQHSDQSECDYFKECDRFSCEKIAASSLETQQKDCSPSNFQSGIEPDDRISEIDPNLYAPCPPENKQPPIIHRFSLANRPLGVRRRLPVEQVFAKPISALWRTKFSAFNHMQSELTNILAYSDDCVCVSAPTGAGKTALFEMAMARFFSTNLQRQPHKVDERQHVDNAQKIVYVSPSKALCDERYEDWSTRLGSMNIGIQVALITGDGDPSASFRDLAHANIILTTPEKWDSLTRRWTENFFLFASVKLFLIDEVHLVADDSRGWCLESVVCRMKTIQKAAQRIRVTQTELQHSSYNSTTPEAVNAVMRIVAVSATLPNLGDIATFVGANEAHSFDDSYRPVPLTVHVIGQGYVGDSSANQYRFWSGLDRNIPELVHRFSKKKPTLVFCHSKADTEKLAELLAREHGIGFRNDTNSNMAGQTKVVKLQKALFYGLAYHHAGLDAEDRRLVEKCFFEGKIRVLCATSTLAMGVNLPAHLVIVKGTKAWRGGGRGYNDLDQATLLQMIGRAGRPGFDSAGTAIIMTDNRSKNKFERLASEGLDPAVSKLCTKLDEVINAEVSQNVIFSTESALNWIKTSLFCSQLFRHPTLFGIGDQSAEKTEEHLWRLCNDSLQHLKAIGALTIAGGRQVFALPASHVMSHNLVEYHAMERFAEIPPDASQRAILLSLSKIEGMHRPVRRSEKKSLKLIHKQLKHKLDGPLSKVTIQQPFEKVFVLVQASIMSLATDDQTLRQEMNMIAEFSSRMLSALEEFSVRSTRHGIVALQSVRLRRALATNCWAPNEGILHQLAGVDPTTAMNLKMSGICSFDDVMKYSSEEIEKAAKRPPRFGNRLKMTVEEILKGTLTMKVHFDDNIVQHGATKKTVVCVIERQSNVPSVHTESKTSSKEISYTLIAYSDHPGGCILYRRNVSSPVTFKATTTGAIQKITFHLIASIPGLDETKELSCREEIKAARESNERITESSDGCIQSGNANNRISSREWSHQSGIYSAGIEQSLPRQEDHVFVTPSPKLGIGIVESMKISNYARLKEIGPPCNSVVGASEAHAIWAPPSPGRQTLCTSSSRQTTQDEYPSGQDYFYSSFEGNNDTALDDLSLVASNVEVFSTKTPNLLLREKGESAHRNRSQTAWKREKLQQHRTQQRAFVRKKDNPFSDFKCDPNNAENALDSLLSMKSPVTNQVIPVEGLKALERAYLDTNSVYEGSNLTTHRRSDFIRPGRVRESGVLRNLPANGFQTRQMPELGHRRNGRWNSFSHVGAAKEQAVEYSGTRRPEDKRDPLAENWHGLLGGNHSYLEPQQSHHLHPAFADDTKSPDVLSVRYQNPTTREYYNQVPAGNAADHNWFMTENRRIHPHNPREVNFGSFTAVDEFKPPQYHGWD